MAAEHWDMLFQLADQDHDGQISGQEAVSFFQRASLPQNVLAQIWLHADRRQNGFLTKPEFYTALQLVTVAQAGKSVTKEVAQAIVSGVYKNIQPPRLAGVQLPPFPQKVPGGASSAQGMVNPAGGMGGHLRPPGTAGMYGPSSNGPMGGGGMGAVGGMGAAQGGRWGGGVDPTGVAGIGSNMGVGGGGMQSAQQMYSQSRPAGTQSAGGFLGAQGQMDQQQQQPGFSGRASFAGGQDGFGGGPGLVQGAGGTLVPYGATVMNPSSADAQRASVASSGGMLGASAQSQSFDVSAGFGMPPAQQLDGLGGNSGDSFGVQSTGRRGAFGPGPLNMAGLDQNGHSTPGSVSQGFGSAGGPQGQVGGTTRGGGGGFTGTSGDFSGQAFSSTPDQMGGQKGFGPGNQNLGNSLAQPTKAGTVPPASPPGSFGKSGGVMQMSLGQGLTGSQGSSGGMFGDRGSGGATMWTGSGGPPSSAGGALDFADGGAFGGDFADGGAFGGDTFQAKPAAAASGPGSTGSQKGQLGSGGTQARGNAPALSQASSANALVGFSDPFGGDTFTAAPSDSASRSGRTGGSSRLALDGFTTGATTQASGFGPSATTDGRSLPASSVGGSLSMVVAGKTGPSVGRGGADLRASMASGFGDTKPRAEEGALALVPVAGSSGMEGPSVSQGPTAAMLGWPQMTVSDVQRYTNIYNSVGPDSNGMILAPKAKELLMSSQLPVEVLRQVWDLSDENDDSMLSYKEFCIALYLVERTREGRPLPAVLPSGIHAEDSPLHPRRQIAAARIAAAQQAVTQSAAGFNVAKWSQGGEASILTGTAGTGMPAATSAGAGLQQLQQPQQPRFGMPQVPGGTGMGARTEYSSDFPQGPGADGTMTAGTAAAMPGSGGVMYGPGGAIPAPVGAIPGPGGMMPGLGGAIPGRGGMMAGPGGMTPGGVGMVPGMGGMMAGPGGMIPGAGGIIPGTAAMIPGGAGGTVMPGGSAGAPGMGVVGSVTGAAGFMPGQVPGAAPPPVYQSRAPTLDMNLANQLGREDQEALKARHKETEELDKRLWQAETQLLDAKQKADYYRTKMQEIILFKSRCDNRLVEMEGRLEQEKKEVEVLSKKYDEKFKQSEGLSSRLLAEEAALKDLIEKKVELHNSVMRIEHGGDPNSLLQERADKLISELDDLRAAATLRAKSLGLQVKVAPASEAAFGWQNGMQENAGEWDREWAEFKDEGFSVIPGLGEPATVVPVTSSAAFGGDAFRGNANLGENGIGGSLGGQPTLAASWGGTSALEESFEFNSASGAFAGGGLGAFGGNAVRGMGSPAGLQSPSSGALPSGQSSPVAGQMHSPGRDSDDLGFGRVGSMDMSSSSPIMGPGSSSGNNGILSMGRVGSTGSVGSGKSSQLPPRPNPRYAGVAESQDLGASVDGLSSSMSLTSLTSSAGGFTSMGVASKSPHGGGMGSGMGNAAGNRQRGWAYGGLNDDDVDSSTRASWGLQSVSMSVTASVDTVGGAGMMASGLDGPLGRSQPSKFVQKSLDEQNNKSVGASDAKAASVTAGDADDNKSDISGTASELRDSQKDEEQPQAQASPPPPDPFAFIGFSVAKSTMSLGSKDKGANKSKPTISGADISAQPKVAEILSSSAAQQAGGDARPISTTSSTEIPWDLFS
ncbi:hypothetical protein CBR_g46891 [Chara braunii]|uniref:Epidermal growth factor receptor substrate 15 n=1 Tax=Chara braunii TaxID=69332 RepID=A0A388M175_CHABU|nr:hypothetical protein CBR_g46891 [Chara braunii]|eukprot:GBG88324.1 hypothetical protein CBR_g46891 [Chara braunii]